MTFGDRDMHRLASHRRLQRCEHLVDRLASVSVGNGVAGMLEGLGIAFERLVGRVLDGLLEIPAELVCVEIDLEAHGLDTSMRC